jgi:hypothetical protein
MPEIPTDSQTTPKQKLNWKKILTGVLIVAVLIGLGALVFLLLQRGSTTTTQVTTSKTSSPSAKTPTPSTEEDETADWKTYENKEYGYSLKYPKDWYESTETKVVSEENNIVYHFYAVAKDKNQTSEVTDQVIVVRYLEGDPCAMMEIKKSDVTVSGYKGQRSDCYEGGQIKVITLSFPNTDKETWFVVAYVNEELELIEKILSTVKFLD